MKELVGEVLVVIGGEVMRNLGVCEARNSKARSDVDFYENEADYFVRGADVVLRTAEGALYVFAPNGPGCSRACPAESEWVGCWCRISSLDVLEGEPWPVW